MILSICIPTYNKAEVVYRTVQNILCCKIEQIEVVVLDNASTDHTQSLLKNITDSRFKYFQNSTNIGSMPNILKVLTLGEGEFVMLCLDKDEINIDYLPQFTELLNNQKSIIVGKCILDSGRQMQPRIFDSPEESILNIAYTSAHPTGIFYRKSKLNESKIIDELLCGDKLFAFNPDLINAQMASEGKSMIVEMPLIKTEKSESVAKKISDTYSANNENLFFTPEHRIRTFNIYVDHLIKLANVSSEIKKKVICKLYYVLIIQSTFWYRSLMTDSANCFHYGVSLRTIGLRDLLSIDNDCTINFFNKRIPGRFLWKLSCVVITHFKISIDLFLAKIKR